MDAEHDSGILRRQRTRPDRPRGKQSLCQNHTARRKRPSNPSQHEESSATARRTGRMAPACRARRGSSKGYRRSRHPMCGGRRESPALPIMTVVAGFQFVSGPWPNRSGDGPPPGPPRVLPTRGYHPCDLDMERELYHSPIREFDGWLVQPCEPWVRTVGGQAISWPGRAATRSRAFRDQPRKQRTHARPPRTTAR
jgi:hypothetical protein